MLREVYIHMYIYTLISYSSIVFGGPTWQRDSRAGCVWISIPQTHTHSAMSHKWPWDGRLSVCESSIPQTHEHSVLTMTHPSRPCFLLSLIVFLRENYKHTHTVHPVIVACICIIVLLDKLFSLCCVIVSLRLLHLFWCMHIYFSAIFSHDVMVMSLLHITSPGWDEGSHSSACSGSAPHNWILWVTHYVYSGTSLILTHSGQKKVSLFVRCPSQFNAHTQVCVWWPKCPIYRGVNLGSPL